MLLLAFLLFVVVVIICAQLNCFIERRREGRARSEIQSLQTLQRQRGGPTAASAAAAAAAAATTWADES